MQAVTGAHMKKSVWTRLTLWPVFALWISPLAAFLFASLLTFHSAGYAGDSPFKVKEKNRIRIEDSSEFSLPYAIRLFHKAETYLKDGDRYLAWKTYLEIAQKMPNLLMPIEGHFESSRLLAWKKMKEILVTELPLAEPPDTIFDRLFETAMQDRELSFDERFFIFETTAPYLPTKKGGFWHEELSDVLFEQGDFFSALCLLGMIKAFSVYYEKGSLERETANRIDQKIAMIKTIMGAEEGNEMKFRPTLHLKTGSELDGDGRGGWDYLVIEFEDGSVVERQFFDIGAAFFPHFFIMSHDYGFLIFDSPSFWVLDIHGNFLEKWRISKEIIYSYGLKNVLFSKDGFVSIPKGIFQMGSPESEMGRNSLNEVLHTVTLTKDFEIQRTEVTQLQWVALMGNAPSVFKTRDDCKEEEYDEKLGICSNYPVESVSWEEAKEFIEKLNQIQSEYDYRLPTEAEWEYAARLSGVPEEERKNLLTSDRFLDLRKSERAKSAYGFGNDPTLLGEYAWHSENSFGHTHPVLNSRKSIGGIYGMHGNVGEWVEDLNDKNYGLTPIELNDELKDPLNNHTGWNRVFRGGSWNYHFSWLFRSAGRHNGGPRYHYDNVGFRLVRVRR